MISVRIYRIYVTLQQLISSIFVIPLLAQLSKPEKMDHLPIENFERFKITRDWNWQSKLILKGIFGQLTLADLKFEKGKEMELLNRIGSRLNKTGQEVSNILKKLKLA